MRIGLVGVVCGLVGLAGCSGGLSGGNAAGSGGSQAAGGTGVGVTGARLTGLVRGGQQPISGAHVYLLAASETGYGGAGIAASTNNASQSLMTSGTLDQSGGATNGDYYVTTDGSGNFSITGDYTCTAGQQVYLYVLGGDPGLGSGVNAAAGLMAALGNCPGTAGSTGDAFSSSLYIVVNEVSTVAAAYAMAGFATDATHVGSSGTALALTGIANAFANAANLETLGTGVALATTPAANGGNGTVPQAEIYSLANILGACVNSSGAVTGPPNATACYTLFTNALSSGTTPLQPTDTATAAINIAHSPGANVAALYGLATANPPFAGGLTAQPNDWTVGINFTGGGIAYPLSLAVDGAGDIWIANDSAATPNVAELSSSGAFLSGAGGYTAGGMVTPMAIAIDGSGNAWVGDWGNGTTIPGNVVELSGSGSVLSAANGYAGGGMVAPNSIAIDGVGNVWVANVDGLAKLSSSGSILSGSGGYSVSSSSIPGPLAIDGSGNAWVTEASTARVVELSSSGSILSGTNGYPTEGTSYTGGNGSSGIALDSSGDVWLASNDPPDVDELLNNGIYRRGLTGGDLAGPIAIAIDGGGNTWIASKYYDSLTEISNSGSILSGANGYSSGGIHLSFAIAIDGSGNAWAANYAGSVSELIGVATPVITPICAGLPNTPTADGSSKLGTRP